MTGNRTLAAIITITGALLSAAGAAELPTGAALTMEDVVFKAKVDGTDQRYVLLLPPNFDATKTHSLIVALHGHGSDRWQFAKDRRDECRSVRDFAARHNLIMVSPDYRAKTSWMGPKAEADMLQILDEVGTRFRVDKVIMSGGSMGGASSLAFAAMHPDRMQGVVAMNGTANLVEYGGFTEFIAASYGGTKAEKPEEYRKRSAELFSEKFTMPVALTASGRDLSVPADSVRRFAEKLNKQNRRVLLLYRPDAKHVTSYADATTALEFVFNEMARRISGDSAFPPEMQFQALPMHARDTTDNPSTPEKIALGRMLFFDPVLSASKEVACATCHHPKFGWGDGRVTPIGVGGEGMGPLRVAHSTQQIQPLMRNVPGLLNVGFNGYVPGISDDPALAPMFWDSRVQSLEKQVFEPLGTREEMRGDAHNAAQAMKMTVDHVNAVPEYRELFGRTFQTSPESAVSMQHIAQALAAFERSLVTPDTPFDRYMRGDSSALDAKQQRGMQVFQEAGCIQCHGGPMLSDYKLHFVAVSPGSDDGRREFRAPTLRNLKHTAPYMHDGSLRTVRDVLVFYEQLMENVGETFGGNDTSTSPPLDPLLKHLNIKEQDFPVLEAFLDSLNADHYDQNIPASVPSGLPVPK